jgi:hypothetical protein
VSTVSYRLMFCKDKFRRPAERMSLELHEVCVEGIWRALAMSRDRRLQYRKSVSNPLNTVRCSLDDWLQCEYGSDELDGDTFFAMYYGRDRRPLPPDPAGFVELLDRVRAALRAGYADCGPVRELLRALDRAQVAYERWRK